MPDKHLSTQFDAELAGISNRVLEMGGLVESQVAQAVYALLSESPVQGAFWGWMGGAFGCFFGGGGALIGELIEFGRTDELFIKPKNRQTEDYITGRFG